MSCCDGCGYSKSILKGIQYSLPNKLSVTEYFRQCIIENTIQSDAPAILAEDGKTVRYTFGELDSLSTKLAKALRKYLGFWTCNNPDGDLVMAFALPISDHIPVLLFAVLKLGATYLSIPPIYPEQLIVKIVSVTKPMIVITDSDETTRARYNCVKALVPIIDFEELYEIAEKGPFDAVNEVFPLEYISAPYARMASIVYTAGTMDQQLAVRIGHHEILNRCFWQYKEFPYAEGEIQSLSSGLDDIDSIAEIFAPLLAGFPVHLIPRIIFSNPNDLIDRLHGANISRVTLTPPILTSLLTTLQDFSNEEREQKSLSCVKYWIASGDTMSQHVVTQFFSIFESDELSVNHNDQVQSLPQRASKMMKGAKQKTPDIPATLIHLYGSTEVMSDVTFESFDKFSGCSSKFFEDKVSIGKPIGNTILYIVDEDMRIVETGVIGEICIAGASVASGGYVTGVEKDDAERFCPNPFTKRKGYTTIYQTEDFGRIHVNQEGEAHLFYEGRTEMKAKVKGQRIDLRNVTKLVTDTKMVDKCTALCFHPGKQDQAIVAFCILLPNVTQQQLEKTLARTCKEEHLMPQIFPVEQFYYLPSGRLDKYKLLKLYLYNTMNASPEEWQQVGLSPQQRNAAKVLFSAIAKYTKRSLKQVIEGHTGSLWSLGIDSLTALAVFHHIRESGFILNIDTFLSAENLLSIVEIMRAKTKNANVSLDLQKFKLFSMPHTMYYAEEMKEADKDCVIRILSTSYAAKNKLCKHLFISPEDLAKLFDANWKKLIKNNMSYIAYSLNCEEKRPIGVIIVNDASAKLKILSNTAPAIKHWIELMNTADKASKEHIVWKKKGTVSEISFMGTAESVSTQNNIMLLALLMEAAKVGAKSKGYNGTFVSSSNELLTDLCKHILNFKLLEEVPIFKFRSQRDKTLPFRLLAEHLTMQVLYESFF